MRIRWDDAASFELREAASFLSKRQRGLGRQLRGRIQEAIGRIRYDPTSYECVKENIYRCPVKRFSYSITTRLIQMVC